MDRLREILSATDSGRRLISLLEQELLTDHYRLNKVAEAITAVLHETLPRDGQEMEVDDGDIVVEFKSIPMKQPLGEYDLVFYKDVFILHSTESRDVKFRIPYISILDISSAMIKGKELQLSTGLDPANLELETSFQDQVFIFINITKDLSLHYEGELLTNLCIEVSGEITAISNVDKQQETKTGNAINLILDALYSVGGLPKEKTDRCLHYKTSLGGTFLVPTYCSTGGYLFLMENSVCFSGRNSFFIPHKEVIAVGLESSQDVYFALVLYLTNQPSCKFERLPNAEKQGMMEYCKLKHLKLASVEDLALLIPSKSKVPKNHSLGNKAAYHVSLRRKDRTGRSDLELNDNMDVLDDKEYLSSDEESSSSSVENTGEGEVNWMDMLIAEADNNEYNESEDEDFNPLMTTTKRKRVDTDEGRFIKQSCTPDGDIDLIEIESHSSLMD